MKKRSFLLSNVRPRLSAGAFVPQVCGVIVAAAVLFASETAVAEGTPQRVVSMNVCTDQLAMLIADKDQLMSVSYLALDPAYSAMVEEAKELRPNRGLAEDIYFMNPDLVISGTFSNAASAAMLKDFGVRVEVLEPAYSLDDVRARITQMGEILGREDAAQALLDEYDARFAAITASEGPRPRAALYSANGWTNGESTFAGQMLSAAGFDNIATELDMGYGGFLPLETLVLSEPEAVILSARHPGGSRAEEIMSHPVLEKIAQDQLTGLLTDQDWVCGTPFVLRGIEKMSAAREAWNNENE